MCLIVCWLQTRLCNIHVFDASITKVSLREYIQADLVARFIAPMKILLLYKNTKHYHYLHTYPLKFTLKDSADDLECILILNIYNKMDFL